VEIVDANVLLYATDEQAPKHQASRSWLDGVLAGQEAVGFAWVALLAFIRLSTNPVVFPRPLTAREAGEQAERWLGAASAVVVVPTPRHLSVLRGLLATAGAAGSLVNDAHLAALALEHDAGIVSFDRDFGRFEGVRWRPPEEQRG